MLAILVFSRAGRVLAEKISRSYETTIYDTKGAVPPLREQMPTIWESYDRILFIGATGIAMRYCAPYLRGKDVDPAVLVMDDQGRFVISLLSGHLGGANAFAKELAEELGATPVITTATDGRGIEGLDLYAASEGLVIEDLHALTPLTGRMVNGEPLNIYNPYRFRLPRYPRCVEVSSPEDGSGPLLAITEKIFSTKREIVYLRPKILHIGVGARRGASFDALLSLVVDTFKREGLSLLSVKDIGTISLKKDEEAILLLAQTLNCPLNIYEAEELKEFDDRCQGSEFVRQTVGVGSVSATSALVQSEALLVEKAVYEGCTLSIGKECP